jgi:hypothetical protein
MIGWIALLATALEEKSTSLFEYAEEGCENLMNHCSGFSRPDSEVEER